MSLQEANRELAKLNRAIEDEDEKAKRQWYESHTKNDMVKMIIALKPNKVELMDTLEGIGLTDERDYRNAMRIIDSCEKQYVYEILVGIKGKYK